MYEGQNMYQAAPNAPIEKAKLQKFCISIVAGSDAWSMHQNQLNMLAWFHIERSTPRCVGAKLITSFQICIS